jgi:hypothetical protein
MHEDLHHYKCGIERKTNKVDVDPVTTQIIRNSLNSAAEFKLFLIISVVIGSVGLLLLLFNTFDLKTLMVILFID